MTTETWPGQVSGVGLKHVAVKTRVANRRLRTTGPMMFTSNGIAGPAIFDLSRLITDYLPSHANPIRIAIDLMPQYVPGQLEQQIISLCRQHPDKELAGVLGRSLPRPLALKLCNRFHLPARILADGIQKAKLRQLVRILKHLPLSVVSTCPIAEATVTRGGISTEEVNPETMESRLCRGLFFGGEVINVDGPCGGFNLQIAFSTGHLAGKTAARYICQDRLPKVSEQ